jgi:hypothetical protein
MVENNEQIQKFIKLCENSSFPHKVELLRGIESGEYLFENFSNSQVPAEELVGIYKIKVKSAARHDSNHSRRLVADTLNFIDELEKVPEDKVNFWHFSIDEPSGFTVFEGVNSQKILGCILTVDKRKVSESEWEELWNEQ